MPVDDRSHPASIPQVDRQTSLVMRGLLIIAIVLGHNSILFSDARALFSFLYKWHVHGFFFLAFMARGYTTPPSKIPDLLVRYMVPFAVFLSVPSLLRLAIGKTGVDEYLLALAVGSSQLCNRASDMSLFWFLPTLAGFNIALALLGRLVRWRFAISVVLIMLCAIGYFIPRGVALYIPLGLPIVGYVLPLAAVFAAIVPHLDARSSGVRDALVVAVAVIAVAGTVALIRHHVDISIFKFGNHEGTGLYLLTGATAVAMNLFIWCLSGAWRSVAWLKVLGERSLEIFLFHSFIQAPLAFVVNRATASWSSGPRIVAALLIAAVAIAISVCAAMLLARMPALRTRILPRDWRDLGTAGGRDRRNRRESQPRCEREVPRRSYRARLSLRS